MKKTANKRLTIIASYLSTSPIAVLRLSIFLFSCLIFASCNKNSSGGNVKSGDWLSAGRFFPSYTHIDDTGGVWANERTIDAWKVIPASGKVIKDTLFAYLSYPHAYSTQPKWNYASPWDPYTEGGEGVGLPKVDTFWLSEKNDSLFINSWELSMHDKYFPTYGKTNTEPLQVRSDYIGTKIKA